MRPVADMSRPKDAVRLIGAGRIRDFGRKATFRLWEVRGGQYAYSLEGKIEEERFDFESDEKALEYVKGLATKIAVAKVPE